MTTAHATGLSTLTVHLPADLVRRLEARAAQEKRSTVALTAEVVAAYLDEEDEAAADVREGLRDIDEGRVVDGNAVHARWREEIAASRRQG